MMGGLALVLSVVSSFIQHGNSQLKQKVEMVEKSLAGYHPRLSASMLKPMVQIVERDQLELKRMARRWLMPAAVNTLARIAPQEVTPGLLSITMNVRTPGSGASRSVMELRGRVSGEKAQQRSVLAAFVLALERQEIFSLAEVKEVSDSFEDGLPALLFTLEITLAPEIGNLVETTISSKEVS
jgi:hypothetical protein